MTWFKQVFGFTESNYAVTQGRFSVEEEQLHTDTEPPRSFHIDRSQHPASQSCERK